MPIFRRVGVYAVMRSLLVACILILALPLVAAAQNCARANLLATADNARTIREELMDAKGDPNGMNYDIPDDAEKLVPALKSALTSTIDTYMRCEVGEAADVVETQNALISVLGADWKESSQVVEAGPQPDDPEFGVALRIQVTRPEPSLPLIAVQTSFGIGCGEDNVLLIYEWRDGRWQRSIEWKSGEYKEISGAFGDFFEFVILPGETPGTWLLAAAHGMPWCTSRWSEFDLQVVQPARSGAPQKVIFEKENEYVRFELDPELKQVEGGFELRLQQGMIDMDVMTRLGIYRYKVSDDRVERVQPVASNGRDFVDEWIQSNWSQAKGWSATANIESLEAEHMRISEIWHSHSESSPLLTFGPVLACADDSKHFQVELDEDFEASTYFQIEQSLDSFTMVTALRTSHPMCNGEDIMSNH